MNITQQHTFDYELASTLRELFSMGSKSIERRISTMDSTQQNSFSIGNFENGAQESHQKELSDLFYANWLRAAESPSASNSAICVNLVDLFSGCGGMTLGLSEAIKAIGCTPVHLFSSELRAEVAEVYFKNFSPKSSHRGDISSLLDGKFGSALTKAETEVKSKLGQVDFLCGGPPCQGHSDLNNYTRREDPRNSLYFLMARAAEVLQPKCVLIENVPGVVRDRTGNFQSTIKGLEAIGYHVIIRTLNAINFGVPQNRKRTFVFAARKERQTQTWSKSLDLLSINRPRNVMWAISDLLDRRDNGTFHHHSLLSDESQRRVDWLFENNQHELPDEMRPDCHKLKSHTYKSVYGRMYEDRPAPTITTGFLVMGQGRFIHPTRRRTITPHEGARIQTFPDFFDFGQQNRTTYAKMIGNAVPPLLAYYVGLASANAIRDDI